MPEILDTPSSLRVAALQNSPSFNALFANTPESIRFKGATHYRDAARSVEEQLWYLSALAMTNPGHLYELSQRPVGPYSLDADDSAVVAAKAALKACQQKGAMLQLKRTNQLALISQAQHALSNQSDFGNVLAGIFTGGIATAVQVTEHQTEINQRQAMLTQIDIDIANNKQECIHAAQNLADAQADLDAANKRLREQEEAARKQKLADDIAEAKRKQDAAEEEAAASAARAAADAAAKRAKQAADEAAYRAANPEPEPDYSNWSPDDYPVVGDEGEWSDDPDSSYWLDAVDAGLYGDEEQTIEQLEAQGEERPRLTDSPYYFDRYYACDACQHYDARGDGHAPNGQPESPDYDDRPAVLGYDAERAMLDGYGCDDGTCPTCAGLEGYGAEGEGVLAIVAGLAAIAPSVINAFTAPSGGAQGNVTKETTDKILKETGVQDKIDAAAKAEGDKARNTVLLVGGGLAILIVKLLS
jgi:hypothetical protein